MDLLPDVKRFSFDDLSYERELLTCSCSWSGRFAQGEVRIEQAEKKSLCPNCGSLLAIVAINVAINPANDVAIGVAVAPPSRQQWLQERREQEAMIIEQLPEIESQSFTLTWNLRTEPSAQPESPNRYWIIKYGERVIYREPARLEDYHRFELLARLLKQKYGERIKDLVPAESREVETYLYGEFLGSVSRVQAARQRNFH